MFYSPTDAAIQFPWKLEICFLNKSRRIQRSLGKFLLFKSSFHKFLKNTVLLSNETIEVSYYKSWLNATHPLSQ